MITLNYLLYHVKATNPSHKDRIITLTCEMNKLKLQGSGGGDSDATDVASIVDNYVKEIEGLR